VYTGQKSTTQAFHDLMEKFIGESRHQGSAMCLTHALEVQFSQLFYTERRHQTLLQVGLALDIAQEQMKPATVILPRTWFDAPKVPDIPFHPDGILEGPLGSRIAIANEVLTQRCLELEAAHPHARGTLRNLCVFLDHLPRPTWQDVATVMADMDNCVRPHTPTVVEEWASPIDELLFDDDVDLVCEEDLPLLDDLEEYLSGCLI
jgi:hypothetical protein